MERHNFFNPEAKAILREYAQKPTLHPQDIVKCYLRIYSVNVSPTYDCRVHLWNTRPGDVVYIDGVFFPLLSRFAIDDGDKHWKCVHVRDRESHVHQGMREARRTCDRQCRKWYASYRKENGKAATFYPDFDGLTTIPKDDIERLLKLLRHGDRKALRRHFTATVSEVTERKLRQPFINKGSRIKPDRRRVNLKSGSTSA